MKSMRKDKVRKCTYDLLGYFGASSSPSSFTISVNASCSQQIRIFPFPAYLSTTSLTQAGSSRSQDVSTVRPRSSATGLTVSRGRFRFPSREINTGPRHRRRLRGRVSRHAKNKKKKNKKLTILRRHGHNMTNPILGARPKHRPQTLGPLDPLRIQPVPVVRLLAMPDQVHGRFGRRQRGGEY